jgi:hypothetical protein
MAASGICASVVVQMYSGQGAHTRYSRSPTALWPWLPDGRFLVRRTPGQGASATFILITSWFDDLRRAPRTKEDQAVDGRPLGVSDFRRTCEAEPRSHIYQVGQGIGLHFLHHPASMCLHRNFADAELSTHLFI